MQLPHTVISNSEKLTHPNVHYLALALKLSHPTLWVYTDRNKFEKISMVKVIGHWNVNDLCMDFTPPHQQIFLEFSILYEIFFLFLEHFFLRFLEQFPCSINIGEMFYQSCWLLHKHLSILESCPTVQRDFVLNRI